MTDLPELERRRLFHGWAFEPKRTPEQAAALRTWLNTGEVREHELRPVDLVKIHRAMRKGTR